MRVQVGTEISGIWIEGKERNFQNATKCARRLKRRTQRKCRIVSLGRFTTQKLLMFAAWFQRRLLIQWRSVFQRQSGVRCRASHHVDMRTRRLQSVPPHALLKSHENKYGPDQVIRAINFSAYIDLYVHLMIRAQWMLTWPPLTVVLVCQHQKHESGLVLIRRVLVL